MKYFITCGLMQDERRRRKKKYCTVSMYFREKTGLFYVCNKGKVILYIACLWQRERERKEFVAHIPVEKLFK